MYLYHFHSSSSSTMYSTILCCGFLIVSAKVSSRKSLSLFDVVSAAWGMKNIRMPAALYCFYLLVIITNLWKYIPAHKIYNKYLIKIKFCHSFCFLIGKVVFKNSYFYLVDSTSYMACMYYLPTYTFTYLVPLPTNTNLEVGYLCSRY